VAIPGAGGTLRNTWPRARASASVASWCRYRHTHRAAHASSTNTPPTLIAITMPSDMGELRTHVLPDMCPTAVHDAAAPVRSHAPT
jgi:hypothetical protein